MNTPKMKCPATDSPCMRFCMQSEACKHPDPWPSVTRRAADSQMLSKHEVLIAYLNLKVSERDWHAVSDAANDLRVLEAQKPQT